MTFARLYHYAAQLGEYPVRLEGMLDAKAVELSAQDELHYVPADLDRNISLGHIKQYRVPQGVYCADTLWVTEIRYSRELNTCWKRFVCCKELMHVFDTEHERTDSAERFGQLLDEIESPLPFEEASPMYRSETRTKWMAVLVLCPKPVRDMLKVAWDADEMSDYAVALELRIPEALVPAIMDERYDRMLRYFVGDLSAVAEAAE